MKIKLLLLAALFLSFGSTGFTRSEAMNAFAPDLPGAAVASQSGADSVSYKGKLQVGKTESVILYVGEESGDYAAFCFTNNSPVGRAILAACKDGEQCQFTGEIADGNCKVPGLEADLSASGKIVSIKSVKSLAPKTRAAVKTPAASTRALSPAALIKSLYSAQEAGSGPFFQFKDRALVNRYFTAELGDLIWKDATAAKGEVGALDFDPLYYSQDQQITDFVIGNPRDDGGPDTAFVLVTFKNSGKAEKIEFELLRDAKKAWKINDIIYGDGENLSALLLYALDPAVQAEYESAHSFKGDYLVGKVVCNVTPTKGGMFYRVKCADQEDFRLYAVEGSETQMDYIHMDEKGAEKGKFSFKTGESAGKFIDATGKVVTVTRRAQ